MNKQTILTGRNTVMEALKARRSLDKILIKEGETEGSLRAIMAKAKEQSIKIERVSKKNLDKIAEHNQGVAAYASVVSYADVDDILSLAKSKKQEPFVLILNNINDPQNLGAIIRTAEGAGVHGVIIPKHRNAGLSSVVEKTSAGAVNYIPVAKVVNIPRTIDYLKKKGLWIIGADMEGKPYFYFKGNFKGPVGLCIGGEGEGLGALVAKKCDFLVSIPMFGNISSLNASVSAGVLMYEIVRQKL